MPSLHRASTSSAVPRLPHTHHSHSSYDSPLKSCTSPFGEGPLGDRRPVYRDFFGREGVGCECEPYYNSPVRHISLHRVVTTFGAGMMSKLQCKLRNIVISEEDPKGLTESDYSQVIILEPFFLTIHYRPLKKRRIR